MKKVIIIIVLCLSVAVSYAGNSAPDNASSSNASGSASHVAADAAPVTRLDSLDSDVKALSIKVVTLEAKEDTLADRIAAIETPSWNAKRIMISAWAVLVTAGLLFILLFYFLKDRKNRNKEMSDFLSNRTFRDGFVSEVKEDLRSYETNSRPDYSKLQERVKALEDSLRKMEADNMKKEDCSKQTPSSAGSPSVIATPNTPNNPTIRKYYAVSILEGRYAKVQETKTADSIFELTIKQGNRTASVSICESAYQKILANPAYLDGCDKQVLGGQKVVVDEEGTAELTSDNRWMVSKKIKVVLK